MRRQGSCRIQVTSTKGGIPLKRTLVQNLVPTALACSLTFICLNLYGQSRVPAGPPVAAGNQLPSVPLGPLNPHPQLPRNGGVRLGQSYDGIDSLGSNCGCLPPDTNAAVGNNFVVETVNSQMRVFDKTTGVVMLDEPLSTCFGAFSGGDPYVVYDDNATGLFLAVSADGNPLDGFKTFHLTNIGGFPDYPKLGFNRDAIFISFNNYGDGGAAATIAA